MHPFMPFITEEIWSLIKDRKEKENIIVADWPKTEKSDALLVSKIELLKEVVVSFRALRNQKSISPKVILDLYTPNPSPIGTLLSDILKKFCNANIVFSQDYERNPRLDNVFSFMVREFQFYMSSPEPVDFNAEKIRLTEDLNYTKGFFQSVLKKLQNEKFVNHAKPEIIELERKKLSDAEIKIKELEEQLASLN